MFRESFNKFFKYFNKNKKSFFKYSILSFIVGVLELFGVALTYPFVLKLLDADKNTKESLLIGVGIVFLFLAKNVFMVLYTYLQAKLTKDIEKEVNTKFMQYFLISSYQESSKLSFAQKTNIVCFLIPNTINNYILRLLNLNVNIFIFVLISFFLVIKFPLATIVTMFFAAIMIYAQTKFFKPKLFSISQKITFVSQQMNQRTNEALLNLKNVKISHNEKYFYDKYVEALDKFYRITRETLFLNSVPPYITEPLIILLLFILLSIISMQTYAVPEKLIASFAVIVSAIFRLAPCISRIQININGINAVRPVVEELLSFYEKFEMDSIQNITKKELIEFNENIEFRDVSFEYKDNSLILQNINLEIKKGEFVGIVGLSGVGKTTLVDVLCALLQHKSGSILVDGKEYENMPTLNIGYIPQEFSILHGTIRENVAYGYSEIDDEKVVIALKKAQLYDFIESSFKDGIYANPFVDSIGFSQGQKQRLAFARAIYSDPDILILDEATSSLDLKTEDEICEVLNNLKGEKTIIAIAHRLSTIKNADKIVYMKNGTITNIAPFGELLSQSDDFRELLKLSSLQN